MFTMPPLKTRAREVIVPPLLSNLTRSPLGTAFPWEDKRMVGIVRWELRRSRQVCTLGVQERYSPRSCRSKQKVYRAGGHSTALACLHHETFQLLSWREEVSPLPEALDDLMPQILWGGGGGRPCNSWEPGQWKQPYIWLMIRPNKFLYCPLLPRGGLMGNRS